MTPTRFLERWAISSQLHARRNAMVAATALAQRRAERDEVDDFLAGRTEVPKPREESGMDHIPDVSTGG